MALKLITPAAVLAVSLAEAKLQCRVDNAVEDTLITAFITTATELAEQKMGRSIMPQTLELTLDAFPSAFELTRTPVVSVTSLKYTDTTGVLQTLGSGAYALDNADDFDFAYVVPAYAGEWPTARSQINAVALRYVAGYADAASVPGGIKSWIKLMVAALYENRVLEGAVQTHSLGFADRLLDRYTITKL